MTSSVVGGVTIRGLACAVPDMEWPLSKDAERFGTEQLDKIAASTGIRNRRLAPENLTAADLCEQAAERLLNDLNWERESIGLLIFISQTPNFAMPATACTLQDRLGLSKDVAAFDVNLGCSGYAYGLWLASSLLMTLPQKRALVLVGDTLSHHVNRDERSLWPLFGDAGTATAVEKDNDASAMYFELGTDGSGYSHLKLENLTNESNEKAWLHMNGPAVFSFTLREVPSMIRRLIELADVTAESIDRWVFHQANEFILRNLQKRLQISDEKFIVDLSEWGNTSGATIPLAIVSSLKSELKDRSLRLIVAGFGVGLSWSSALIELSSDVVIPDIIEVPTSRS